MVSRHLATKAGKLHRAAAGQSSTAAPRVPHPSEAHASPVHGAGAAPRLSKQMPCSKPQLQSLRLLNPFVHAARFLLTLCPCLPSIMPSARCHSFTNLLPQNSLLLARARGKRKEQVLIQISSLGVKSSPLLYDTWRGQIGWK